MIHIIKLKFIFPYSPILNQRVRMKMRIFSTHYRQLPQIHLQHLVFSSTPSNLNTRIGKNGTVWSSFSSLQGKIRSHNIINKRLHGVRASDIYTTKDAFSVKTLLKKLRCVQTFRVDGSQYKMLYKKTNC